MINNESTQNFHGNNGSEYNAVNNQPKKDDTLARAGFAAGGFVAGAASTAAVNVMAAKLGHQKDETLKDDKAPADPAKDVTDPAKDVTDPGKVEDTTDTKDPATETTSKDGATTEVTTDPATPGTSTTTTITTTTTGTTTTTTVTTNTTTQDPTPQNPTPQNPTPQNPTANVEHVNPANIPTEQESIIATDEGIRVAQVNDDMTFSQAFAEARQQVGPGGVFEWHGKVYGTYYKNEWDQMSGQERAEWQAKVDYDDVRDPAAAQHYAHQSHAGGQSQQHGTTHHDDPHTHQVTHNSTLNGLHVVEAGQVDFNGERLEAAVLEDGSGDRMMIVDTDGDGTYDVALHDDNYDGQIDENELHGISHWHTTVQEVHQAYQQQNVHQTHHTTTNTEVIEDLHIVEAGQLNLGGESVDAAILEDRSGEQILIVDTDGDGKYDMGYHDDNHNGQMEEEEFFDMTMEATVEDVRLAYLEQQSGNIHYADNSNPSDYNNNGDISSFV